MKISPIVLAIIQFASLSVISAAAEESNVWRQKSRPGVHGVTLGSSEASVLKELGRPQNEAVHRDTMAGMEDTRTYEYRGLIIKLNRSGEKGSYRVWEIDVNGGDWIVSPGVKVGMTKAEVVKVLGALKTEAGGEKKENAYFTFGEGTDAYFRIAFSSGVVTQVSYFEDYS